MSVLIYDSGIGGLGIAGEFHRLSHDYDIIYFADDALLPYGNKSDEVLTRNAIKNLTFLQSVFDIELIILACNTLTAVAVEILRSIFSVPIIGTEPAIKPARRMFPDKKIYVLLTESAAHSIRIKQLDNNMSLIPIKNLAYLIENDATEKEIADCIISEVYINENESFPLVLGCTHYPFVKHIFSLLFPKAVIFDGNQGTAKHALEIISKKHIKKSENASFFAINSSLKQPKLEKIYEKFHIYYCNNSTFKI